MYMAVGRLRPEGGDSEAVPLTGDLKLLFAPYAGQVVMLCDSQARAVSCRVNARGDRLRGPHLGHFVSRLGPVDLVVTAVTNNFFVVAPRPTDAGLPSRQPRSRSAKPKAGRAPKQQGANPPSEAQEPALAVPTHLEPEIRLVVASPGNVPWLPGLAGGKPGSGDDLHLRRQALALSVHPGFDTLLALSSVRNVSFLDYQLNTVRHVLKNLRGRALLCDEVGLGKTIEAGLILMEYLLRGLVRRVLILTPPSLVEQWREELRVKFNQDFVVHDAPQFRAAQQPWMAFPRIIASLDTAKREPHRSALLEVEYDLVIVDEAHHLKSQRTLAYQLVSALKKKYILLLTATPVQNHLDELFNLITLLLPGQLETSSSFRRKYIDARDPLVPRNAEALKQLLREVMVRNRRGATGAIRSQRHAHTVELELSAEEDQFYQALTAMVRARYEPAAGLGRVLLKNLQREAGSSVETVLPTLEKMAARDGTPQLDELMAMGRLIPRRAKVEALLRLLAGIPGKAIVFTSFVQTHHLVASALEKAGMSVARLHGGMSRQAKEEQVQYFAGPARVLVSTETGSEGRNLQFCRVLVNFDLPWNPMRIEQRIGRLHRLGQEQDVHVWNLSARGTVESHILELLDAKINLFQLVIGELDAILGELGREEDFEDMVLDIWARSPDEAGIRQAMAALGDQLVAAKERYQSVRELDDRLLGELLPRV